MILSDAPSCGVTHELHSDDSRGVIYIRNMFIIEATGYGLDDKIVANKKKINTQYPQTTAL
jgi:hypothetical protein